MPLESSVEVRDNGSESLLAELIRSEEAHAFWQAKKVALIARTLKELNPRGRLADVGCFTGIAAETYRAGFDKVVGFDSRREALDRAASRGIETRCWTGGAEPLPAKDCEFDCVVASNVIEHIFDTDAFVEDLSRILRPGGRIILTTPNLAYWISRLRLLRGKTPWAYPGPSSTIKLDVVADVTHIRLNTAREWRNFFEQHSLTVERVEGWSLFHGIATTKALRIAGLIDRYMTKWPDLAFGLMFVLAKGYRTPPST